MADEIQRLNTTGFLFTSVAQAYTILRADYGGGLQDAVTIGGELRTWQMKIDVLPDNVHSVSLVDQTQFTRAAYLWKFYQASKANNDAPFWFRKDDPGDEGERDWLASFAEDNLSFEQLCSRIYRTGLTLKQRALRDQESPGDVTSIENPNQI